MLNLARNLVAVAAVALLATSASAQELAPLPEAERSSNPAFQIVASADDAASSRLDIWQTNVDGVPLWTAVLNQYGAVTRATDDDCLSLKATLDAFEALPALTPGPRALRPTVEPPRQIPNRRIHAPTWRIGLPAYAPDNSSVTVEVIGSQGPYAGWVNSAVRAIKACKR